MTRRLFGPVSGPIAFFLVAALVFAGLGWVTYSALGVERSQRESAARAEIGNNLRVALWQLDSRMLPTLGVEDSRPYYHYAPPDPAATPLLVASLPDWMKLHFQLDRATGWTSPLVCDPTVADQVREAWAEVTPHNLSPERAEVLKALKFQCPACETYDLFAATDRSIPSNSLSLAAPLVAGDVGADGGPHHGPPANSLSAVPQSAAPSGTNSGDKDAYPGTSHDTLAVRLLGVELCLDADGVARSARPDTQNLGQAKRTRHAIPGREGASSRGPSQVLGPGSRGGRLAQQDVLDNERQVAEWRNRAGLIDRAIRDAKNAAEFQMPKGQLQNSYGQNYLPGLDARNYPSNSHPPTGSKVPGGDPNAPFSTPGGGAATRSVKPTRPDSTSRESHWDEKGMVHGNSPIGPGALKRTERDKILLSRSSRAAALAHAVCGWFLHPSDTSLRGLVGELENAARAKTFSDYLGADGRNQAGKSPPTPVTLPQQGRAAVETGAGATKPAVIPGPTPADPSLPQEIHLGSMRPQWVAAPDGSDVLVLVRAARVDETVIYQGVVVDWPKLSAALTEEIRPLFPQARLVPIKDSSAVYPDRAMTALPVQLDPGPEPELPPAGWTPLRIGLVMAWIAAIIAFTAVGFAGWGLIDLAERRIRFVSAVTHELRTPLTSLRLYLDLLVSGMIEDEQKRREYLATLAMESDRLHRLIDNVLDYAKLEKRRKNGDIRSVRVNELLDQIRQTWTDRVAQDGKELLVISTLPPDFTAKTDASMIQQIVGNLIDNARKYTRDATDSRIWVWAKPGRAAGVVLEVEDRGAGVPVNERKTIFRPFRRGEQADTRAGGAGLGLALAQSWAEALGGTLTYRPTEAGIGACFQLELPGS